MNGVLPAGTTRKRQAGYEEVTVPPAARLPPPEADELVGVDELPPWAQQAFAGVARLNRIQSRIFPAAWGSNENLLVCAPTGAGKTNIAMLCVLHELASHMRGGALARDEFKIVYVAPMKALAAEVAGAFGRRLAPLGCAVRELTGDMQLSKAELAETQMLVTTPEKWDVITRKGGEAAVSSLLRLLIIDEVHILNDERGAVIETLVARTRRQVEASQAMIRLVGLSATLPSPADVAQLLGVTPAGLFTFDASFRPIPLTQRFIGVSESNPVKRGAVMSEIAYREVAAAVRRGKQAMVFVHSRKDTGRTARWLAEEARKAGDAELFAVDADAHYELVREVGRSRNRELAELVAAGFAMHHAGMARPDRSLAEKLFARGAVKALVCTATLAWGVNLPAHAVVIKGTQLYDAARGGFKDLGVLDVAQIFGRAGRPGFDDSGEGVIITEHRKLPHYLGMLTHSVPIESQLLGALPDNLNAEVVLGTVSNVREGASWLGYTYLHVRMQRNPLAYGLTWADLSADPALAEHRQKLVREAARALDRARMLRFDERSGQLYQTEAGRIASHFYVRAKSMEAYNDALRPHMSLEELLATVARSAEFENVAPREEEMPELEALAGSAAVPCDVRDGLATREGKANALIQAYISRAGLQSFSLVADTSYVSQSVVRICRALFELCLRRGWPSLACATLSLAKAAERRMWPHQHPLRQFEGTLPAETLARLEGLGPSGALERLADMSAHELAGLTRLNDAAGARIADCCAAFPRLEMSASVQPITRSVLRVALRIEAPFAWRDGAHGGALRWVLWVEDQSSEHIYHSEVFTLTKRAHRAGGATTVAFTIPVHEPLPPQYYVVAESDSWLGARAQVELSFRGLLLPERHPPHTELLPLRPLPLAALRCARFEALYAGKFTHFNAIQTQAFHTLYHSDENVLLGAPTGSGKTISAELAMMRVFAAHPGRKVVYIAPLKALVRERVDDWRRTLCPALGVRLVELTGDHTPDARALLGADVIVATPEKWDGISRSWRARAYVTRVALVVIDEIHLLGADRGPILEVIVSRMRYIAARTGAPVRTVGLSTALANAQDLADWLGIRSAGLFNFRPSVRPVPLECHIQGYPGKHYCPRMQAMNKPAFAAIRAHSPSKPALVFVSSRRQTRLTALDLIALAAADETPHMFLHARPGEADAWAARVRDASLRHTLQFGVGLHHAGLEDGDRSLVEELFAACKIQVLVSTSTLAWGVNLPAHLVVVKGTEFYDGAARRYVDFPITDVLQMMGRAGRPQFDTSGVCVIMVHEPKKAFYKKFLYEPFPVESSLVGTLPEHFNAEVVAGTIRSKQDAVDYLTWTYFFRRLVQNPSYYSLDGTGPEAVNALLSSLVEEAFGALEEARCVAVDEADDSVAPLMLGRVASFYYLRHKTVALFAAHLGPERGLRALAALLCRAAEYDELPVRHNEDKVNAELARAVVAAGGWPVDARAADDPHVKAELLLQAHLLRLPLPVSDYVTDAKSVLDQSVRILQAMVDVAADAGWLATALSGMQLNQLLMQGRWHEDAGARMLPHVSAAAANPLTVPTSSAAL